MDTKIQPIESVTGLVNRIFSAYGVRGLDWEEKINEYADIINDLIDYDTDLTELYKKIRLEFAHLPQPSSLRKMMKKTQARQESYISHPDDGKNLVVACYRNGKLADIYGNMVICNSDEKTTHLSKWTDQWRKRYDEIKIFEFSADSTLIGNKVFIPTKYNNKGECIEQEIREIA